MWGRGAVNAMYGWDVIYRSRNGSRGTKYETGAKRMIEIFFEIEALREGFNCQPQLL